MHFKDYSRPEVLEKYSFWWSEARLVIAAVALLIGGVPVLRVLLPAAALSGLVTFLLTFFWILSGIASGYLLYRWAKGGQKLFGGKNSKDTVAFFVSVLSGLNLGLTGLLNTNIGMSIASGTFVFILTAIVYVAAAAYLFRRWNASGKRMF